MNSPETNQANTDDLFWREWSHLTVTQRVVVYSILLGVDMTQGDILAVENIRAGRASPGVWERLRAKLSMRWTSLRDVAVMRCDTEDAFKQADPGRRCKALQSMEESR